MQKLPEHKGVQVPSTEQLLEDALGQPVELTVDVSYSAKVGFQTPLHSY